MIPSFTTHHHLSRLGAFEFVDYLMCRLLEQPYSLGHVPLRWQSLGVIGLGCCVQREIRTEPLTLSGSCGRLWHREGISSNSVVLSFLIVTFSIEFRQHNYIASQREKTRTTPRIIDYFCFFAFFFQVHFALCHFQ